MTYKPSDDPRLELNFNTRMLDDKDSAFHKEVAEIVDKDLMQWYYHTASNYRLQTQIDEADAEVRTYAWLEMLKALEDVFHNYVSLKYPCG
jgi:hypothetical protein